MARILALDYGLKRTGIAVTDPSQMIASGLTTIDTYLLLEWLKTYCGKETVERFIIGIPTYADGNATPMADAIERFIEKLEEAIPGKEVIRQDERYSSRDAAQVLFAAGVKKKKRQEKGMTDKIAAAIILQAYMEANVWKS